LIKRNDISYIFSFTFIKLLSVRITNHVISLYPNAGFGSVDAGKPGALMVFELAIFIAINIFAKVPDVTCPVLG